MSGILSGLIGSLISAVQTYWINSMSDTTTTPNDVPTTISVDSSNNLYVGGYYPNSSTGVNAFLEKYNASGAIQWQRKLSDAQTAANQYDTINASCVDSSGNIYVVGAYNNGNASGVGANGFLAKYNSAGTLQFQRSIAGLDATNATSMLGVAVDSSGNIYISGYVALATVGQSAGFLAKYNSAGTLQFQRFITDINFGFTLLFNPVIESGAGNIYVCGYISDATTSGLYNGFVAKYNSSGVLQWQRRYANSGTTNILSSIALDSSNNVYVAGSLYISAGYAGILAKYNSSGVLQWQRRLDDISYNSTNLSSISSDSSGNLLISGRTAIAANPGSTAGFLARYNSSGALQWQRTFVDSYTTHATMVDFALISSSSNMYLTGSFYNTAGTINTFVASLPFDGSLTGTYTTTTGKTLTYAVGTVNDTAATISDAAGNATDAAGTATDAAGTLTSATLSNTNNLLAIALQYGYVSGGSSGATLLSSIEKLNFSNDTTSAAASSLSSAREVDAGFSNNTVAGYFAGGNNGSTVITTVDKLLYSTDAVSTLGTGLTTARSDLASFNNPGTAGYVAGGYIAGAFSAAIDKFAYPSDTHSVLSAVLTASKYGSGGYSNHGVAGYYTNGANAAYQNTTDKLTFATDTISNVGSTPSSSYHSAGMENSGTAGYEAGGAFSADLTTAFKLTFSNDTITTTGAVLATATIREAGLSNKGVAGYLMGGTTSAGGIDFNTINKISWPTDTRTTASATMVSTRRNTASASNGAY